MKFACSVKDIGDAVSAASKVVKSTSTVPVLSNLLLEVSADGGVEVRGTDLEMTSVRGFPAEVATPGKITVPAKLLAAFLSTLTPGVIEFEGDDKVAHVKHPGSTYKFNALDPETFPPLPSGNSKEARGAVLMGALMEFDGDTLTVAATDGYQLSKTVTKLKVPVSEKVSVIVPARALAEAVRDASADETVSITTLGEANNHMSIRIQRGSLVVRLVEGQYPNFRAVIPSTFDRSVVVNTEALVSTLRRASLVAADRSNKIDFEIDGGKMIITADWRGYEGLVQCGVPRRHPKTREKLACAPAL